jgi:hypothetical protein
LQEEFREEVHEFEEGQQVPYVTSIERLAKKEGKQEGARGELIRTIRATLKDKFGPDGARLMVKIRAVDELRRLRALMRALVSASSLDAFRRLLD